MQEKLFQKNWKREIKEIISTKEEIYNKEKNRKYRKKLKLERKEI